MIIQTSDKKFINSLCTFNHPVNPRIVITNMRDAKHWGSSKKYAPNILANTV